jgi:hypothetical protein
MPFIANAVSSITRIDAPDRGGAMTSALCLVSTRVMNDVAGADVAPAIINADSAA